MAETIVEPASNVAPTPGERTKRQQVQGGVASWPTQLPGFINAPRGIYHTYRKMRGNPTIALARLVATAPIRAAEWSYELGPNGTDDMLAFVQSTIDALKGALVAEALRALDYGWQPFEKVWEYRGGRYVLTKMKPLLPDLTEPLEVKDTGQFAGLRNRDVDLGLEKSFVFTYDSEGGAIIGRSRHENVREKAWHPWEQLLDKKGKYVTKVSGAIPIVRYPQGKAKDASGTERDNFDIAKSVLAELGKLSGVAAPLDLAPWAADLLRSGVDVSKLLAWQIDFLESKGQHGGDLTNMMRYFDSLMMRGWLVPERAALEGQHGTKAESETQTDIVIAAAEQLLDDIVAAVNADLVEQLLTLNFGQSAKGAVRIAPAPLVDEKASLVRKMIESVLTNPANLAVFLKVVDMDAAVDQIGLPKREETIDNAVLEEAARSSAPVLPGGGPFPLFPSAPAFDPPSLAASMREIYADLHQQLESAKGAI